MKRKLQVVNLIILLIVALASSYLYFIIKPDYGLAPFVFAAMLIALMYLVFAGAFLIKGQEQHKLITIACWINFFSPLTNNDSGYTMCILH